MTTYPTCRHEGCSRMVSRDGHCRPHFIREVMGWKLREEELRRIPLGLLTDDQLRRLRKGTSGARDAATILAAIKEIDGMDFDTSLSATKAGEEWEMQGRPSSADLERMERRLARDNERAALRELMRPTADDRYAMECLRNIEAGRPHDGHPDQWDD